MDPVEEALRQVGDSGGAPGDGRPEARGALRGSGAALGPCATRLPAHERTIPNLLRLQAEQYGEKPWLVFDAVETLTYAEAERLANRVANAILGSVGPRKHVGLYLRNQYEFLPAQNGALSVGVAVPLNADARGPLLEAQIVRADLALLIARVDLLENLAAMRSLGDVERVIAVGEGDVPAEVGGIPVTRWEEWIEGQPTTLDVELPAWDELAVIAFTSGSTGQAKGVMHTHHFWYLFSAALADSLERQEDDVLTTPLPLYHGGALHLIANCAFHAGCTAHLQSRFSPRRFWSDAARDGANHAFLLGPLAAMIDRETPEDQVPEHRVANIYCLPSPPGRAEFERKFRTTILRQGYGMTEIFPCPMRNEQLPDAPEDSIAYPATYFDYAVVDEDDNILGPGEVGEMVWRSNIPYGMFSGYYREPDATLDAFRNLWFHTGDAGSYEPDGMLRFRGRLKDRIRRRGENVNAGEIEYVALLHDAVREAAAYGVPAELGEEDIKLDLVLSEPIGHEELHGWLSENLPRFMVPRYLEFLDELPKTPTMRVEKYKLRAAPVDRPGVHDAGAGGRRR